MANGREVVFTWMDMNDWGKWMKAMYGIQPNNDHNADLENVKVIIADHSVCHCYFFFLFRCLTKFLWDTEIDLL